LLFLFILYLSSFSSFLPLLVGNEEKEKDKEERERNGQHGGYPSKRINFVRNWYYSLPTKHEPLTAPPKPAIGTPLSRGALLRCLGACVTSVAVFGNPVLTVPDAMRSR
jgi:hypothetical protein